MNRGRRVLVVLALGGVFFVARETFAQSSPNFQNTQSSFAPAVFEADSPNYQISGSVEHIVGVSQSASYETVSGVPFTDAPVCGNGVVETGEACDNGGSNGACPQTCSPSCVVNSCSAPPPSGGGGGGGGGGPSSPPATTTIPLPTTSTPPVPPGTIPQPTLTFKSPTFKSTRLIGGNRPSEATSITVNGSSNDVRLFDPLKWDRNFPLFLGMNDIYVVARSGSASSLPVYGQIERMLIGDVNRSRNVDDVDLSLFTRAWKTYNVFADFNEDGLIDDADLSLLASHWGRSY